MAPWEKREMVVVRKLASEQSLQRWGQVVRIRSQPKAALPWVFVNCSVSS